MSILKTGFSAFGKLFAVAVLATAFFAALLGVLYFALRSPEVKIPSIVGKDKAAGEQELAAMGLKIRQRATRFSQEKVNTILEQTPIAGEMVKGGQTISVVISRAEAEGDEKPAEVKKESVDDKKDTKKDDGGDDEKDVTVAPKKKPNTNKNANSAKNANSSSKNTNSNGNSNANTNSNENTNGNTEKNKNTDSGSDNKPNLNANSGKSNSNTNNRNPPPSGKNTNQNSRPATVPPPAANNKNTNSVANRRPIP